MWAILRKIFMYGSLTVLKLLHTFMFFSFFKKIKGKIFYFSPNVFSPHFFVVSSTFFVDNLIVPKNSSVLDLGTGSGILAIFAADKAQRVLATDISPYSVENARMNVRLNTRSKKIKILRGNLFKPVSGKFDLILFNPPYFPLQPKSYIEAAWNCGQNYKLIQRFLLKVRNYLSEEGFIELSLSSYMDLEYMKKLFKLCKFQPIMVARKFLFFEVLYIYILIPQERYK